MKILADENIPGLEAFTGLGQVTTVPGRDLCAAQLKDVEVLLVRSVTRVDQALLADSPVRFVGTATIGTDHVDLNYLQRRSIIFTSAPGSNASSVAEYVLCCLAWLHLQRRFDITTQSVGIVGMGNVGSRVYQLLQALDIACLGYDPLIPQDRYPVMSNWRAVSQAQALCLHTPLTLDGTYPTRHMLNSERISQLPAGQVLLNAGRGAVIDNKALRLALAGGQDIVPVLDVWENEPDFDTALLQQCQLGSPHIAGYSYDGKLAATGMLYEAVCHWLGKPDVYPRLEEQRQPLVPQFNSDSEWDQLCRILLAAYNPVADDADLRLAASGDDAAATFDKLRKNYPRRREFTHFIVDSEGLSPGLKNRLDRLGFQLSDD
jgi:erythronate-4-phosphate dehydrogenase